MDRGPGGNRGVFASGCVVWAVISAQEGLNIGFG